MLQRSSYTDLRDNVKKKPRQCHRGGKKETLDDLNIGIMPGHNSSPHPPHAPPSTAESLSFNFNRGPEGEGGWKTEDG